MATLRIMSTTNVSAKSPRTKANYLSALHRFRDFLVARKRYPKSVTTDALRIEILERFYAWLPREPTIG
jgi:hypothetical protein